MKQVRPYFITDSLLQLVDQLDGHAFFVGGCVRDFLMHRPIHDIDMATPLTPQQVQEKLADTSIRIIPTGIAHGTLTLLLQDGHTVEITSYRQDIRTDGRHAVVQFGTDMKSDAMRRDLTINALYMDINGQIFDYTDGRRDLKQKYVRFIGDADTRIREDALRLLRFYRFYGLFARATPDKSALHACRKHKKLLQNISAERIKDEFFKILSLPAPYKTLHLMQQGGILHQIFTYPVDMNDLRHLIAQEKRAGKQASALFRAWVLSKGQPLPFQLTRAEKNQIQAWDKAVKEPLQTYHDFQKILFLYGQNTLADMILMKKKKLNFTAFQYLTHLPVPKCPFTKTQIKDYFHLTGSDISKTYDQAVDIWIKNGFIKKDVVFSLISQ